MSRLSLLFSLPLAFSSTFLQAQDGEQLYGLYCSACHGADGKGAGGGAFPPLAGSEWVEGNPKRAIAIVLKGLTGPIDVAGKSYNLVMSAQENTLSPDNITAILNYVNKSWGNNGETVKPDMVKVAKAEYASRSTPWTAPELLKLFPLEKKVMMVENLTSQVFKGNWDKMPDFKSLTAENIEEEHSGLFDIKLAEMDNGFSIVWEGDFKAPSAGEYEFIGLADDAVRILIDGKKVCEVDGIGPAEDSRASKGKVSLKAGANPIRVEYMEDKGEEKLLVGWRQVGSTSWNWLTPEKPEGTLGFDPILLSPTDGKTVIYRNFIKGASPKSIGFGFPGDVNLVFSADLIAPQLVWAGGFIDAGRHWTNRGSGFQEPFEKKVTQLTKDRIYPANAKFRGYSLDKAGNPTFHIQIDKVFIKDSWIPKNGGLLRTMSLTGGNSPIEIPLGDNKITTPAKSITLMPGKPSEIIYKLK